MEIPILSYVVDEAPDSAVVDSDGLVIYANRSVWETLGLSSDTILGNPADSVFSGWPDSSDLIRSATKGSSFELTGFHANGEEVSLLCSVCAVENGEIQFAAFLREHEPLRMFLYLLESGSWSGGDDHDRGCGHWTKTAPS